MYRAEVLTKMVMVTDDIGTYPTSQLAVDGVKYPCEWTISQSVENVISDPNLIAVTILQIEFATIEVMRFDPNYWIESSDEIVGGA